MQRKGSILIEVLFGLILLGGILSLSYQMLQVLEKESYQAQMNVRKNEMADLCWRIDYLAAIRSQTTITPSRMTFKNQTGDNCCIIFRHRRLIYQKNNSGYYVLCTDVKKVHFSLLEDKTIRLVINYLDGTVGTGHLTMYGRGIK